MSLIDEWNELLLREKNFYIFGASAVAERIFSFFKQLDRTDQILGFLVSDTSQNPAMLFDKPVVFYKDVTDKATCVLITVSKVYHSDVFDELKRTGFSNLCEAHPFFSMDFSPAAVSTATSSEGLLSVEDLEKNVRTLLSVRNPAFSDALFYQSYPALGWFGDRPTDERFQIYGLDQYLSSEYSILDIGSNLGFFDLTVAPYVKNVLGIEFDPTLVTIAEKVSDWQKIRNVQFLCADYNEWIQETPDTYDVIFSFAVHIWLDVSPADYSKQLFSITAPGGYLLFESQTIETDKKFSDFCNHFVVQGYEKIWERTIRDDGRTNRIIVLFQKPQ
ncbi:MAG: class I SAM-dependent methyltransferase [Lachnospiraceae bacterium]|jgi:SAM-dependent methyltransferase|nr:class I SAM-dependent methyltransferase [Lachnospiraceae bacterium]